jgi:hypothetical protein
MASRAHLVCSADRANRVSMDSMCHWSQNPAFHGLFNVCSSTQCFVSVSYAQLVHQALVAHKENKVVLVVMANLAIPACRANQANLVMSVRRVILVKRATMAIPERKDHLVTTQSVVAV